MKLLLSLFLSLSFSSIVSAQELAPNGYAMYRHVSGDKSCPLGLTVAKLNKNEGYNMSFYSPNRYGKPDSLFKEEVMDDQAYPAVKKSGWTMNDRGYADGAPYSHYRPSKKDYTSRYINVRSESTISDKEIVQQKVVKFIETSGIWAYFLFPVRETVKVTRFIRVLENNDVQLYQREVSDYQNKTAEVNCRYSPNKIRR